LETWSECSLAATHVGGKAVPVEISPHQFNNYNDWI
jgi:hypothetical protein